MKRENLNRGWTFDFGLKSSFSRGPSETMKTVDLPHDYMIESEVYQEAPSGPASGYYNAGVAHYTKSVMIPEDWKDELVFLHFDGVMMNATIEVNGTKAALQHYGYAPFTVEITPFLYFGQENSITVTVNPSMQPNSRWYSGAGMYRGAELLHAPKVYLKEDGIYGYTKEIEYDENGKAVCAYLNVSADIVNRTDKNVLADVCFSLYEDTGRACCPGDSEALLSRSIRIQLNPGSEETAYYTLTLPDPKLWDAEEPNLYRLAVSVRAADEFRTHILPLPEELQTEDCGCTLFGIRTIRADVNHGLRINQKSVKLKGGCLHHDNGLLGAVSLYDAEYRKLSILKSIGFNAVRTTHNPPSSALVEACDRLGIYIFDEAFDAWGMGKQPGDYNQFFETDWEKDLRAFVRRDRVHPSVIIWSTGNEITERGGLGNGYTLASNLAKAIKALDPSRPVSNGICSFWNGLDDQMMAEAFRKMTEAASSGNIQNIDYGGKYDTTYEDYTEAFTNGLDIVGYNYLENKYEYDHERFPERVILGSENFPREIGRHWPMIEKTPHVIGDFTWTAADYIGEAGIGKSVFVDPDDPILERGRFVLSSHTSDFPWRLANDADIDICGNILPQGLYRKVVFGSDETFIFSYDPANFGKTEVISQWGFTAVKRQWKWEGQEGKPVRIAVFSRSEEVEVIVNGKSLGRKKAGEAQADDMPCSFVFDTVYEPGTIEAVSFAGGKEVSRDLVKTHGTPAALRLIAEKDSVPADGESLVYVRAEILDENGAPVPDAEVKLAAEAEGSALTLLGFGSGNPITAENYTKGAFTSFNGKALAVLRAGYDAGETTLKIKGEGIGASEVKICAL